MAGSGSRLRASGERLPKPLVPIAGRPLASYGIEALREAGVRSLHVVTGGNRGTLLSSLPSLVPAEMRLNPIQNPNWQKQNGVSVLCAAGEVRAPFFLTMGDHLFDSSIIKQLAAEGDRRELNLAIDRKINTIFDLDDAMKVRTQENRVVEIGKDLLSYDAIDTGVFLCPAELFDYLHRAQHDGDCSLADGVRLMARDGKVQAIDIGEAWWQDVDNSEMRTRAEEVLSKRA